ncbi:hypothetical protein ATK36_4440 [Amycolatopsis sulphurea]|uniref:ABC-type transport system involved in multi-copper enzyme maturation permease subunit n=2 Tax=Amycolatopsis sulphurea TaxID=76022 RepID=A0A2A9FFT5_9PSEU|nr:hypothetical protein ATK36_4440 [Amycolatopsis sulphurea]
MVRMLRVELRRTIALWLPVAIVVVAVAILLMYRAPRMTSAVPWGLDSPGTVEWTRFSLIFLWPIIVGAAAIQGMRESRAGVGELFSSTPRPTAHRALILSLAVGLAVVVGYLLLLVTGLVQVAVHGGMFTAASLVSVVLGFVAVLAGVALGLGVGRLLPHPVTAPALTVLALVATVAGLVATQDASPQGSSVPSWLTDLSVAVSPPESAFLLPSAGFTIGQLCWLSGLTATGLLVLMVRPRARLLAVLPVVAGLTAALLVFPADRAGNLTPDKTASALVCDGPVCVTKLREKWLPTLAGPGKEAIQALQKLPQHPERVEESTESNNYYLRGQRDPARLLVPYSSTTYVPVSDLTAVLLDGAGTPRCIPSHYDSPEEKRETVARWVMQGWLAGSATPPPAKSYQQRDAAELMPPVWTALHALPEQEQIARVAAARQVELTCQGDPLAALTGGAG